MLKIKYCFHSGLDEKEKEKTQGYINKKLKVWEKWFKRMEFPPSVQVETQFLPRKKRYKIEMQLESSIGKLIGKAERQKLQEGIDEVLNDMRHQFHRCKSKIATLRKRGGTSLKKRFSIHNSARYRLPNTDEALG